MLAGDMYKNILIICTGNMCRSPMAEGILRKKAANYPLYISSAGTHAVDGLGASFNAIDVAQDAGVDISGHSSRLLTETLLEKADIVFAMEQDHLDFVNRFFPEYADKVHLLRTFGRDDEEGIDREIDDPVGGSRALYEQCFRILEREIECIVPLLTG